MAPKLYNLKTSISQKSEIDPELAVDSESEGSEMEPKPPSFFLLASKHAI